jgi:hypothetical protein
LARLELQLEKLHLGTTVPLGVVTTIRQIQDGAGKFPDQPFEREIVIPIDGAHTGDKREVSPVPDGTYRIEARLPSGEVLHETCTVGPERESAEIIFMPRQSPREWLSLQRLAGNVPSQDLYEKWLTTLAAEITDAAVEKQLIPGGSLEIDPEYLSKGALLLRNLHLRLKPTIDYLADKANWIAEKIPSDQRNAQQKIRQAAERGAAEKPDFRLVEKPLGAQKSAWDALVSPAEWALWEADAAASSDCSVDEVEEDAITLWRILQKRDDTPMSTDIRRFAVSRREQGVDVISIPAPWPLNKYLPPPIIEILRESGTSSAGRTTLTVYDTEVGGLLLYLNNGRIGEASTVLAAAAENGLIERMISEKEQNPLAACAAAYVGLATLSGTEFPKWVNWLTNVNDWFPWLPDGAIVHAIYLLKTARSKEDLDAASKAFVTGYERGIPYYATGVQQLLQGLYVFRSRDKKIDEMYKKVSSVALRVDPDQTFTVIGVRGDKLGEANADTTPPVQISQP